MALPYHQLLVLPHDPLPACKWGMEKGTWNPVLQATSLSGMLRETGLMSAGATSPAPCEFAQAPTDNWCEGVLAWHIREGHYGDVRLDDLSVVALGYFEGNRWAGEAKAVLGLFFDERADEQQREALQMVFGGQAGGWPADFAEFVGEVRGVEFVPIEFEVADDLA
jgi:hypothetical protein